MVRREPRLELGDQGTALVLAERGIDPAKVPVLRREQPPVLGGVSPDDLFA